MTTGFYGVFCRRTIIRQLRKWDESKIKKIQANQIFHAANKKNFLCCVVKKKFRYSFVLPKKYSVREINNFPRHYKLVAPHGTFWIAKQNKTLFTKTHFDSHILLLHHSNFIYPKTLARGLTTLSEETNQHKHTYVTPSSSLNTNKLPSR